MKREPTLDDARRLVYVVRLHDAPWTVDELAGLAANWLALAAAWATCPSLRDEFGDVETFVRFARVARARRLKDRRRQRRRGDA